MKTVVLPKIFSQWDSRWANQLLGYNTNSHYNLYNFGCTITCHAMIAQYVGYKETPETINEKLKDNDGFAKGGGLYVWGSIKRLFPKVKEEKITRTPAPLTDFQVSEIKSALDRGHPVLLQIDVNPKTVEFDMHYVLAVGYNPDDENDILIADPLGGFERSLKHYLGWFKPSMRNTIEQYIIYEVELPDRVDMKDMVIDFDDAEGKRKTVGWYVYEWFVEKTNRIKQKEEYEIKLSKKDRVFNAQTKLLNQATTEIERQEGLISKQNDTISTQKTRIDRLEAQISSMYTAPDLIRLLVIKILDSLGIGGDNNG